jgi:hypothetical protein
LGSSNARQWRKRKSSEPARKGASTVTTEAKVAVASLAHRSDRDVLAKSKPDKLQKRVAAAADVAAAVELDFASLTFSRDVITNARKGAAAAQEYYQQPRGGVSNEVQEIFRSLEQEAEGWAAPRLTFAAMLRLGAQIHIPLDTICTADCLKVDKTSKKGHPGMTVACSVCVRSYHVKCMESEGLVAVGLKKADILLLQFTCGPCGGTKESNRMPLHIEARQPIHSAAGIDASADASAGAGRVRLLKRKRK